MKFHGILNYYVAITHLRSECYKLCDTAAQSNSIQDLSTDSIGT